MNLKAVNLFTFCFGLLSAGNVFAQCEQFKCEGVTNTVVQSLKSTESGIFLTFPLGTDRALACDLKQGRLAELDQHSSAFNSMHSLLLTAIASNAPVIIEFSPAQQSCQVTSVEILVSE